MQEPASLRSRRNCDRLRYRATLRCQPATSRVTTEAARPLPCYPIARPRRKHASFEAAGGGQSCSPTQSCTALADPDIKARIADLGGVPFPSSPADLGRFIVEEAEKWRKVIRAANIKPG
jgi:hypothetical protein